jgi:UDP-N-acetylmuramoyl-tripeptide--D-alanyl-D-alanine ligase
MTDLWTADELAIAAGSLSQGFPVSGISIDTRTVKPGDLFVALKDARDGHDFVGDAIAKGAAGAMVSRDVPVAGPLLRVDDTLVGLTRLAEFARARARAKIVAVTGSVGKTTTKEMLRQALAAFGRVHAADASFNNHIGVPLTLARLPRDADFGVIEIGMNHPGEISPLARLARPHAAIVTCVERTHIGLLGSLEAIAAEKASIFKGLVAGGTAVLPRDSAFLSDLSAVVPLGAARLSFGWGDLADAKLIEVENRADGCDVLGRIAGTLVRFHLAAPGAHMAMNAMAALAACNALGLDVEVAAVALDNFAPLAGRGARRHIKVPGGSALLLDESYNASAASMRAAFAVLALQPGRHVAVLGDMLELGDEAEDEHLGLTSEIAGAADIIFTCGDMMGKLFDALPKGKHGAHATDAVMLAPLVKAAVGDGDVVLVKGSYGSNMRAVIASLELTD